VRIDLAGGFLNTKIQLSNSIELPLSTSLSSVPETFVFFERFLFMRFLKELVTVLIFAACSEGAFAADLYDPLIIDSTQRCVSIDLMIEDSERDRELPLRVYLPHSSQPAPVILFSHGLGGSSKNNPYLGNHWAARGYIAVFMQHPGSDESVWRDVLPAQRMAALKEAASARNATLRYKDVSTVIDQLELFNADATHPLSDRMNLGRIGMSGHSFGAVTTQAVSGQKRAFGLIDYTDSRIDAALAMSPSVPRGGSANRVFASVEIPWLLMTGSQDSSKIGGASVESRLAVFPALPDGDKYELVLDGAEHSAFTDAWTRRNEKARNKNHHRVIQAISTAFWDAYLMDDKAAKEWLVGAGTASVLEAGDRWQWK